MTAFDLSPGFVRMRYVVGGRTHFATYQVRPSGIPVPGVLPALVRRDAADVGLNVALTEWVNILKTFYFTSVDFQSGELWYKPTPTSDPIFIYSHPIAIVGTSATATRVSGQYTQTFRTIGGSILKIVCLEPSITTTDSVDTYPYAAGINKSISDYITGTTGWIRGRDDTFPIVGMKALLKTNDALRKKQFAL